MSARTAARCGKMRAMKIRLHLLAVCSIFTPAIVVPLRAAELPGAGALADVVLKHFDTNGDSKIDSGEWQAGVEDSFREMDADGDGRISGAEMDALGEAIGKEAGEAAGAVLGKLVKTLLLTMDADKDGSVSRDEFMKATGALFAKLDVSKNAELTRDELLSLPLKMLAPGGN